MELNRIAAHSDCVSLGKRATVYSEPTPGQLIAVTAWRFATKKKTKVATDDGNVQDNAMSQRQTLKSVSAVGGSAIRIASAAGASDNHGAAAKPPSIDASVGGTGRFDVLRSASETHSDSAEEMNETVIENTNHNGC